MKEIAEMLVTIKAFSINDQNYTWASGIESPFYCDNRMILSFPKFWQSLIDLFCQKLNHYDFDGVAGVATAGIPHASAIAYARSKPLIYVRSNSKGHGKKNLIEGDIKNMKSVALIEDLFSTGGSAIKAAEALEEVGIEVKVMGSIFNYGLKSFQENINNREYFSLISLEDILSVSTLGDKEKELVDTFIKEHK